MPQLKLTYFDFDGGRGEAVRLALHAGGITFKDHRIAGKDWPNHRDETPLGALPVLEMDGRVLTQCNAMLRHAGRLGGLVPKDEWQAVRCDELLDAVEDVASRIGFTIGYVEGDVRQAVREKLAADTIPRHLRYVNARLEAAGGDWFFEDRLTIADLKVWLWVRWLRGGVLDDIPKELVEAHAPLLVLHADRVADHPKVADWYAKRQAP